MLRPRRNLREAQLLLVVGSDPVAAQLVAICGTEFPPSSVTILGLPFAQNLVARAPVARCVPQVPAARVS